jgi:hypothetical protein
LTSLSHVFDRVREDRPRWEPGGDLTQTAKEISRYISDSGSAEATIVAKNEASSRPLRNSRALPTEATTAVDPKTLCEVGGCDEDHMALCDYPVADGKKCDKRMCEVHRTRVGNNMDYCPDHRAAAA